MIYIHFNRLISPFQCGENNGFHVSSHDLTTKDVSMKERKNDYGKYVQSEL